MRFGEAPPPKGYLPAFSVGSEVEAVRLLVRACAKNYDGEFVAKELAEEQTIENLYAFGSRLKRIHDDFLVPHGLCDCKATPISPVTMKSLPEPKKGLNARQKEGRTETTVRRRRKA